MVLLLIIEKFEHIKTSRKNCLIHSKEINHSKGSSQNKRVVSVLNNLEKVIEILSLQKI